MSSPSSSRRIPWRYELWDILTRQYLGSLPLGDVQWNRPLEEAGKLTATLRPGTRLDGDTRAEWASLIQFDRAWLFCRYGRRIPWAGQLMSGPWRSGDGAMSIGAVESRGWLDEIHLCVGRDSWGVDDTDQLQIVRQAIGVANRRAGTPDIRLDAATSGVRRSARVEGQAFKPIAEFVNELAGRERGFDWTIGARESPQDGKPELHLVQRYPEWDLGAAPRVHLVSAPQVSTVHGAPDLPRDASDRRTVVYASGEGQSPDQAIAVDIDPLVHQERVLRRETITNHSGVADVAVLDEHAHTERLTRSRASGTLQVDVPADDPDFTTYDTGSRVRLTVQDEFSDVTHPAVRVLERTMRCDRRDGPDTVTLTLDLADTELPDGVRL